MVKKEMKDKVQVSMWIQTPLKHLVDNADLNLTRFVNDGLETYFSVSNTKQIESEILAKKTELLTLEQRLEDFQSKKVSVETQENVDFVVLSELKENFAVRGGTSKMRELNEGWIKSPRNLLRCKALKKDPEEVLDELEVWYDDEEKGEHKEN